MAFRVITSWCLDSRDFKTSKQDPVQSQLEIFNRNCICTDN